MKNNESDTSCVTVHDMPSKLDGVYANSFKVGYNAHEFVFDFGQHFDEVENEKFHTRIVANPRSVEVFYGILSEALQNYKSGG